MAAERLAELIPLFGPSNSRELIQSEAAVLVQREAPGEALGGFGEPLRVRRSLVLAAENGSLPEQLDRLDALLASSSASCQRVELRAAKSSALYLDLPGTPEWYPFAIDAQGEMVLALERGVGLVCAGEPA